MRGRVEVFQQPALLGECCLAGQVRTAGSLSLKCLSEPFVVSIGAGIPGARNHAIRIAGAFIHDLSRILAGEAAGSTESQLRLFRFTFLIFQQSPHSLEEGRQPLCCCRSAARGNLLQSFSSSWRSPESRGC